MVNGKKMKKKKKKKKKKAGAITRQGSGGSKKPEGSMTPIEEEKDARVSTGSKKTPAETEGRPSDFS